MPVGHLLSSLTICTLAAASAARAQTPGPESAPITNVRYEVRADSAAVTSRHLGVTMTFHVASAAPVALALPAWSPGHYTLLWFARRVSRFTATQAGAELSWHKRDFQTWEITPHDAGDVSVSFQYLADTIDRAVAWTRPNFTFFNGTNVYMYPVGRGFDWPATVTIHTEPTWRIATGMTPGAQANSFTATNYHDLVDMPTWVGRFAIDSTRAADRWVRLAMYPDSSMTPSRRDRILGWLSKFVPVEAAVFNDVPFRNYTVFLLSDTVVNAGGLEHQSSQMDELPTPYLDNPRMWSLFSHEFFHAWNVKRLRPADMVPYHYDDVDPTKWLWVSEGITDYYAQVALVRAGITDSTDFLNAMGGDATAAVYGPQVALSDASLSVWIDPTDGSGGLYYPKGADAGFLLDIMIRDASNNAHSLDDVMRTLYATTYKRGHGFTASDWWSTVSRVAGGRSFADFARRYVDGREPMPFDSTLPLAGLQMVRDTAANGRHRVRIVTMPNASAKALRIRDGIMHGTLTK